MDSYLVLGHITEDVTPHGPILGGTALYAAHAAKQFGYNPRIVTSMVTVPFAEDVDVVVVPSASTTTFVYDGNGHTRSQRMTFRAESLGPLDIPSEWYDSSIWHLAPVADEVTEEVSNVVPSSSFVGVTPQGWLREVGPDLVVRPSVWRGEKAILGRADAVVLSHEDVPDAERVAREWSMVHPVVALTQGRSGSNVYVDGVATHVDAFEVEAVDDLGAGDVFATAFFVRLRGGDTPEEAARFASAAAAQSLLSRGPEHLEGLADIERLLASQ